MSFLRLIQMSPFIVSTALTALTALNLASLPARAAEGGNSGGGGDASEARVDEIRADILKWISEGGAKNLRLPARVSHESYVASMSRYLSAHAVVMSFVTTAQENEATDPELKVVVDGHPKTCRGFMSAVDQRPHILCNVERYAAIKTADEEYRLVHHEYAGLAGVEHNLGASSDYEISNQLTEHLTDQVVRKLAVKTTKPLRRSWPDGYRYGIYNAKTAFTNSDGSVTLIEPRADVEDWTRVIFCGKVTYKDNQTGRKQNLDGVCKAFGLTEATHYSCEINGGYRDFAKVSPEGVYTGLQSWHSPLYLHKTRDCHRVEDKYNCNRINEASTGVIHKDDYYKYTSITCR